MSNQQFKYSNVPTTSITIQISSTQINELIKNLAGEKKIFISFGDVVFYAICQSLSKFPIFNSYFSDMINIYPRINVGYSININDGPKIAVIKDADKKELGEISQEIKRLALMYLHGKLADSAAEESTFLVNNLSSFNSYIVKTPLYEKRAAMISISSEYDSFKEVGKKIISLKKFNLSLSFDSRVADCKQALNFLNNIRTILENINPKIKKK